MTLVLLELHVGGHSICGIGHVVWASVNLLPGELYPDGCLAPSSGSFRKSRDADTSRMTTAWNEWF